MDRAFAETLQMLIGFGAGVTMLVAILKYKLRRRELETSGGRDLEEIVENLRLEVQELREDQAEQMADVHERLEFAERLLTKGGHTPPA
jgi:hypothetical protein